MYPLLYSSVMKAGGSHLKERLIWMECLQRVRNSTYFIYLNPHPHIHSKKSVQSNHLVNTVRFLRTWYCNRERDHIQHPSTSIPCWHLCFQCGLFHSLHVGSGNFSTFNSTPHIYSYGFLSNPTWSV